MSLVDHTNEEILLSLHLPLLDAFGAGKHSPAHLSVDADHESSRNPAEIVWLSVTDDEHDSDSIKLTYGEAGLLHDRLGRSARHVGLSAAIEFGDGVILNVLDQEARWTVLA